MKLFNKRFDNSIKGRTPCGVRGLKLTHRVSAAMYRCRTPCGVRGLKLSLAENNRKFNRSHPVWGAWIETGKRRR